MTGCWSVARDAPGYPASLSELRDPPEQIWGTGACGLFSGLQPGGAVTIVGARRSGAYGTGIARELGRDLAGAGVVVVSGMALGCDAAALEGALEGVKAPLAVLGSGPDVAYPHRHRGLHESIVSAGGAIISERAPGSAPEAWAFPRRNRIMAALSALTIVVEGREASGTRITATDALTLGRTLGAVPGSVTAPLSQLPNGLIKDGANPIHDAQDALDLLCGVGAAELRPVHGPALDDALAEALDVVEAGATDCDALASNSHLSAAEAAVSLARLELLGYLRGDHFGRFERTALRRAPGA